MSIQETLQNEIQESKTWIDTVEGVYRQDLIKRIELINWVLEQMKNPHTSICAIIESKMNKNYRSNEQKNSLIESDPLDSELRILDWILYQACSNEIKKF
jgi:hypothetical protein